MQIAVGGVVSIRQVVLSGLQTWGGMVRIWSAKRTSTSAMALARAMSQTPRLKALAIPMRVSSGWTV